MFRNNSPHSFYVPVMGTGFTIDTPLAIAKYGISSVISLVDDILIEKVRKFWCEKLNEPYVAITSQDKDCRARRITAYLNLVNKTVNKQISVVKAAPFEKNSEITRYYEMVPKGSLKAEYERMLSESNSDVKLQLQEQLRKAVIPGSIDVNIMTKLADADSALRGYANSNLSSSIVFSAGFNPQLYSYIASFDDFLPNENGDFKKKICLKVSDYRSAEIQSKYLTKRGLWVSEYRVESPLNCGGHAFINNGQLIGPILEEFKERKDELVNTLHGFYKKALGNLKKLRQENIPRKFIVTAQGGIGTSEEHEFLIHHYGLASLGWGSPFLLVPETTNVDEKHIEKLIAAKNDDIFLSQNSPMGVPFWILRTSDSEKARLELIAKGTPGNICTKGFAKSNQEFTKDPICKASREYQRSKLDELNGCNLSSEQRKVLIDELLSKTCICQDLAASTLIKTGIDKNVTTAVCPGPNIINFKKIMTLKELVDHIYGRVSLLANNGRSHMFLTELKLQINYLADELKKSALGLPTRSSQKLTEVKENLMQGIAYYQRLATEVLKDKQEKFLKTLYLLQKEISSINVPQ